MPHDAPRDTIDCDIAIYGGGIAGLWTLARLRRAGYRCVLVERTALGAGQTVASQGIIHGGIKYALTGAASRASRAIAEMPGIWQSCLRGRGDLDLQDVHVLSDRQYLWTAGGVAARIAGVAASKAIRTEVARVETDARPPWLAAAPRGLGGIDIYTVEEPILDPASLLRALARDAAPCLIKGSGENVRAQRTVLTAGAGNAGLLRRFGIDPDADDSARAVRMQTRPLHMVMTRARGLPSIYGHCLGASTTPRLTITTQTDRDGRSVLYLGGALAEEGVKRSREEQIAAARAELRSCLPWLDWVSAEFATLRIDRAEGLTPDGSRPDEPVVASVGDIIAAWPTKLAFAPLVAQRILDAVEASGLAPNGDVEMNLGNVHRPSVAPLPWEEEGVPWS